jgi:hypothetical protein
VKYIDPDGMKIVGTDGKPVTFSPDKGWSSNAPKDVIKVGNAMMRTKTGTKVLNDMFNAKYDISISIQQKSEGSPQSMELQKHVLKMELFNLQILFFMNKPCRKQLICIRI